MKKVRFLSTALFIAILLVSCNTFKTRENVAALDDAITYYNVALRWGMYKTAYSYHYSQEGIQPPAKLEKLAEISVTGVKVTEKTINQEHNEAYVEIIVTYFYKTEGNIKELKLNQKWWFNKELEQWFVDYPFPLLLGNILINILMQYFDFEFQ